MKSLIKEITEIVVKEGQINFIKMKGEGARVTTPMRRTLSTTTRQFHRTYASTATTPQLPDKRS